MSAPNTSYSGIDNLEVMAFARRYNAFLVEQVLGHARGSRAALDFGAGIGTFARAVRTAGVGVTCVETDIPMAERLRRDGFEVLSGLRGERPDRFDFIYSLNVLEHIEDDLEALREMRRCLQPGGKLYLFVPAFPVLFSAMDRKVGHLRRYSRRSLAARLDEAGFSIERWAYADSLGYAASLVFRLFGNASGSLDPRMLRLYDTAAFPISRSLDRVLGRVVGKNLSVLARRVA